MPWTCVFAGEGPLAESVARRAAELGLAERVSFIGEVKDARVFWGRLTSPSCSQITRAPRTRSSRPRSRAVRWSAPPSAARSRRSLADGGLSIEPADCDAAAAARSTLIERPERRLAAGLAAHAHVSARYAEDRFATGHMAAVEEALGSRR